MHGTRIASAAAAAGLLALAGAGPAMASESSGADVYKQDGCVLYDYSEFCGNIRSTINVVDTASGRIIMNSYQDFDTTETFQDGFWISRDGTDLYHSVRADGQDSVIVIRTSEVYTSAFGTACTGSSYVHFANGEYQFIRSDFECL